MMIIFLFVFLSAVSVRAENTDEDKPVIRDEYTIEVLSRPDGADIFINDTNSGKTPLTIALPRGPYVITAKMKRHDSKSVRYYARLLKKKRILFILNAYPTELALTISPENADFLLEKTGGPKIYSGEFTKSGGKFEKALNPGEYILRAGADGYWPASKKISLKSGAFSEVSIVLEKRFMFGAGEVIGSRDLFYFPSGAAADAKGIYVCDAGNKRIQVLTLDGMPLETITPEGDFSFSFPAAITRTAQGFAVSDTRRNRVLFFDNQNKVIHVTTDADNVLLPTGISGSGDTIAVTDSGNGIIHIFKNRILRGSIGKGAGLRDPADVCFLPDNQFVVSDWGNKRLVVFSESDRLIKETGLDYMPGMMTRDDEGFLFVCDKEGNAVHIYTPELMPEKTITLGGGKSPEGIAYYNGTLYLTLRSTHQMLILKEKK